MKGTKTLLVMLLVSVSWTASANATTTLHDWHLNANWPVAGTVAYDVEIIRFSFSRTNHSVGAHVEIASQTDDAALEAGRHYFIADESNFFVNVAAAEIGHGAWYWRACTGDADPAYQHCTLSRPLTVAPTPPGYDPSDVDYCSDGYNNDEDPYRDERDPGCHDNTPFSELITSQPRIALKEARSEARSALYGEFGTEINAGYTFRLKCERRSHSRHRFRCRTSWVVGDLGFHGFVDVSVNWRRSYGEFLLASYRMRIYQTNWYCQGTGGSNCVKIYRRKG